MNEKIPNILLVEDSPAHAKLTMMVLAENDMPNRVYHVEDGEAALEFLQKNVKPELIFLDLKLPKMDGIEVLRRIKNDEEVAGIPVVVLTTSEAERDMLAAYDNMANAYIVKPVDYDRFMEMMNDIVCYWIKWNKTPD